MRLTLTQITNFHIYPISAPDSLSIDNKIDNKNNISTPDVISIILGSPNTTPMLKKGDKVGDPFNTQHPGGPKEEPQLNQVYNLHPQNSG